MTRRTPWSPFPAKTWGGYRLRGLAGQGGFGRVYLAERGGQRYALKLLPLAGASLGSWGERELLMLAKVRHPNVVRLLGHWQWPDRAPRFLVIIMEYVDGQRLDVWAATENPSAHAVLHRVLGVARALRALHQHRALHRDVKEANILVRAADGEAVLVDLGVGSHEDLSRATGGSLPPGTRAYLSPEAWHFHQVHREQPDARYRSTTADDVYALGVVLYWLLTDRKPFPLRVEGDEAAIISERPEPPRTRNPRVPDEASALCMDLLEKLPGLRPDAAALVSRVEELLSRDGSEWHVPLCDSHDTHNATTRPGPSADEEALWFNEVREDLPPRRGRRPWFAHTPWSPSPAHVTDTPAPDEEAPPRPHAVEPPRPQVGRPPGASRTTWPWALFGVLALMGAARLHSNRNVPPPGAGEPSPGFARKVAPAGQPLESSEAAAPPGAVLTPAAIALAARTPMEPAPVTTQNPAGAPPLPARPGPARGNTGRAFKAAAAACSLLGCPGPQVRPTPTPEPCPPGAVETMARLGIDIGAKRAWSFGGGNRYLTVREGWTSVEIVGRDFGNIPNGSMASGRLIFGDRVYGRMTQVRLDGSEQTVPVCFELLTSGSERGLDMEPGDSPGTARVFSVGFLRAVSHFE